MVNEKLKRDKSKEKHGILRYYKNNNTKVRIAKSSEKDGLTIQIENKNGNVYIMSMDKDEFMKLSNEKLIIKIHKLINNLKPKLTKSFGDKLLYGN